MKAIKARVKKCQLLIKMQKYPKFSKKIGLSDQSTNTKNLEVQNA